eukprot:1815505-Rhodomonas_salina.2
MLPFGSKFEHLPECFAALAPSLPVQFPAAPNIPPSLPKIAVLRRLHSVPFGCTVALRKRRSSVSKRESAWYNKISGTRPEFGGGRNVPLELARRKFRGEARTREKKPATWIYFSAAVATQRNKQPRHAPSVTLLHCAPPRWPRIACAISSVGALKCEALVEKAQGIGWRMGVGKWGFKGLFCRVCVWGVGSLCPLVLELLQLQPGDDVWHAIMFDA